jgi:predicted metal-dependent HD superfamily phosphohydrolase
MNESIAQEWFRVFGKYPHGEEVLCGLIQKINYEQRAYHNLTHLEEMTRVIQVMSSAHPKNRDNDYDNLIFATLYHDAVYDTAEKTNEEASALMANDELRHMNVDLLDVVYVVEMILSTKKHEPINDDIASKLFLDADLSILAAAPERYSEYANAIRKEYSWVSDFDYAVGRKAILEKFAKRRRIFITDLMHELCDQKARNNIKRELAKL